MENLANVHSYDEEAISFYNVDQYISQIGFSKMKCSQDVFDYIRKPIDDDDENRNFYIARSIVRVLYEVQLMNGELPPVFLDFLLHGKTKSFLHMCSHFEIPCCIIDGITIDCINYRHETNIESWCAFMANGLWHFVDLDGIFCATTFYETEGRIILEKEGKTILSEAEQGNNESNLVFEDFWFCLKPNILIFYSFPFDPEWRLLDKSTNPRDIEEFCGSVLYTYPSYHILGLQVLTERFSKLYTKNGRCTISIKADPSVLRSKSFPYTLSLIKGTGDISGIRSEDLPLLVRYAPGIDTLSFNIRCPVSGEYVFEVSVTDPENMDNLCFDVVIVCEEADKHCKKLPIDAGIVGYGYGHTAKDAGLKNPSKASPTVCVNQQTEVGARPSVLTFQIDDDHIDTIEYGSDIIAEDGVEAFSETLVDTEKGKLTVLANVKTEGEYALSVTAKDKQSGDKPETVLNYLLTTQIDRMDEKNEYLMKKRKCDVILEGKMEERRTMKNILTKKIHAIEKELIELGKLDVGAVTADCETYVYATGNSLSLKGGNAEVNKSSKTCRLM